MRWPSFLARPAPTEPRSLPEGLRVYAVGDVHGRADLLAGLEARIARDLAEAPPAEQALVVFLGDYVDRGPDTRGVLDRLRARRFAGLPARFLLGNHEDAMLDFMVDPLAAADWLRWGGDATLASYGVAPPERGNRGAVRRAAAALAERVPLAHHAFLHELELVIELGDFVFVHAGMRPGVPLDRQRRADLLGIREPFLAARGGLDHRVVHGHTIADEVELLPHRIGVDTGAYASGWLSAVAIEGAAVRVLPD